MAIVIPHAALGTVLETFNETTVAATSGKLTFGLAFAIWAASVGFSAIQDSLNVVYKVKETRSYLVPRISAIGVTIILMVLVTLMLASMLGADLFARMAYLRISHHIFAAAAAYTVKGLSWFLVVILLSLFFAVIYYFAPDVKTSHWHWLTPGAVVGIIGWLLASIGLRVYVHFFNDYSVAYGGLGARNGTLYPGIRFNFARLIVRPHPGVYIHATATIERLIEFGSSGRRGNPECLP